MDVVIAPVAGFNEMPVGHVPICAIVALPVVPSVAATPLIWSLATTLGTAVDAVPDATLPASPKGFINAATELILLAQEAAGAQLAPGVCALGPPVGSMDAEFVTDVLPAVATGVTTTAMVDVPPAAAIEPPAKLQVNSPDALTQVQFGPVADTNVRPAGNWSLTWAVVAAAAPLFVVVKV